MIRPVLNMVAVIGNRPQGCKHGLRAALALTLRGMGRHIAHMIPPRIPVTPEQIDRVVATFYAAIRRHEVLAPIFAAHITDWPVHEAKIAAFWRNAILYDRSYDGSPMRAHMRAGNVRAAHFPDWLMLFDETLRRTLPQETAQAWSGLAHRIGAGLRMGVQDLHRQDAGPPVLR